MFQAVRKPDPETHPTVDRYRGLVTAIRGIFNRKTDRATRWTGFVLMSYHLNPFGVIPTARPEFFDGLNRVADNLQQAYRGGLFRRDDDH